MQAQRLVSGLLLQHWNALRAFALSLTASREDAEDLVHDTAVRALRSAASFDPGSNFQAWIFTIERNCFLNSHCRRPRLFRVLTDAVVERLAVPPNQEARVALSDTAAAIRRLPYPQRRALMLVAADGVQYEEAARLCGCSVGTVKSRVARARKELLRHNTFAPATGRPG